MASAIVTDIRWWECSNCSRLQSATDDGAWQKILFVNSYLNSPRSSHKLNTRLSWHLSGRLCVVDVPQLRGQSSMEGGQITAISLNTAVLMVAGSAPWVLLRYPASVWWDLRLLSSNSRISSIKPQQPALKTNDVARSHEFDQVCGPTRSDRLGQNNNNHCLEMLLRSSDY